MNRIITTTLGTLAFILVLGLFGTMEYNEEVIYNMSDETYQAILDTLGENASESAIVDEYMSNRLYYEQLNKW